MSRFAVTAPSCLPQTALAILLACGIFAHLGSTAEEPRQTLRKLTDGLVSPLNLTSLDAQRLLVADQIGLVHVLDAAGNRRPEPFLDVRPKLTRLSQRLQGQITRQRTNTPDLLLLLQDPSLTSDETLPHTGVPIEWERALSASFIHTAEPAPAK